MTDLRRCILASEEASAQRDVPAATSQRANQWHRGRRLHVPHAGTEDDEQAFEAAQAAAGVPARRKPLDDQEPDLLRRDRRQLRAGGQEDEEGDREHREGLLPRQHAAARRISALVREPPRGGGAGAGLAARSPAAITVPYARMDGFLTAYVKGAGADKTFYIDVICSKYRKGKALMADAERVARSLGCKTTSLRAATVPLIPIYQRLGYQRRFNACKSYSRAQRRGALRDGASPRPRCLLHVPGAGAGGVQRQEGAPPLRLDPSQVPHALLPDEARGDQRDHRGDGLSGADCASGIGRWMVDVQVPFPVVVVPRSPWPPQPPRRSAPQKQSRARAPTAPPTIMVCILVSPSMFFSVSGSGDGGGGGDRCSGAQPPWPRHRRP